MVNGYVYLLEERGDKLMYKIGFTKNEPNVRLRSIKTGNSNPIRVLKQFKSKYYIKIEGMVHRRLFMERKHLEWFELSDDQVKEFINYCQEAHDTIDFLKNNNHFYE